MYEQDVNKQIAKACKFGLRLHYLATDLRTFADRVGTNDIDKLKDYAWFNHHFVGGSSAGEGYKTASNENYNGLGFCIRETQSAVLGTTQKTGNAGADLITKRAKVEMKKLNKSGLTTADFHTKEGGFHCEHNIQVNHIKMNLIDMILNRDNDIDPLTLVKYVISHSLIVTVYNTERDDSGEAVNNNQYPFHRYVNPTVLQYTDDGFEDVTNCTLQEVNNNRWTRNSYYKAFKVALENIDKKTVDTYQEEIYNSVYMKEAKSSTSPILTDKNLKVLVRNDSAEIAVNFYPDKMKDRWRKKDYAEI